MRDSRRDPLRGRRATALALCLAIASPAVLAKDVSLVGILGENAVLLSIDGGEPKTVRLGQKWSGISVVSIQGDRATLDIDGKRRVLVRGQHAASPAAGASTRQTTVLSADTRGHFMADGAINGGAMRFLVDTGATMVAIPARDAVRLGIDYRTGRVGTVQTAGGPVRAYAVRFDTVRLGEIQLAGVEGVVIEQGLDVALLGMTFLNRLEMKRDGPMMTLVRRY